MSDSKIIIPPIKCQGIKTKLIPFIKEHVKISDDSLYIEPFVGTGAVAFNLAPKNAILSDKNEHIINFYKKVQSKEITSQILKKFLNHHGERLSKEGLKYYQKMRDDFNQSKDSLYFLFLNRCSFNGMIRFNKEGNFNVPYCHKDNRFSKSYITKICNQVDNISKIMEDKNWTFKCCDFKESMMKAKENDCIYLDPPYIGRDTTYFEKWNEEDAISLANIAHQSKADIYLSMWKENQFRKNDYLFDNFSDFTWYEEKHYYYLGGKEENRHPIIEVLAIKK